MRLRKMRNLEEFNGNYTDKAAIIIGSGPSLIGHIEFLQNIPNNCVSFAVNSGYVGCPNADFFITDDWEVERWDFFSCDLRKSDKTVVLLYEDKLKDKAKWFGGRAVLFRHRTEYHLSDQYSHNDRSLHLQQSRNSVGTAIGAAHVMGLSPIILLGVDGCRKNGHRWFWQYPQFPDKPRRLDGGEEDKYHQKSSNSDADLVDILRYWRRMGPKMLDKCDIYNASPTSVLDIFPKVDLKGFLAEHKGEKDV